MNTTLQEVRVRLEQILQAAVRDSANPNAAVTSEGFGLDSVALLEFVIELENEFGVLLDDGSLTVERFESLDVLAEFVYQKLQDAPPQREVA